jgi:threonine aldolase
MIDLRSDTLTQPTDAMRAVMAAAEVGDDVYGEDPTVNDLERHVADLLGMDAGMFVSSGTQSNLCGILAHCQRGDEYLVGQSAHTYRYEAGGAAVLGGIQPQPIEMGPDGTIALADIERYIKPKPNMHHFANSKLLCLENTKDGQILPPDYVAAAQELARAHGLSLHLDGARLWNAAVGAGVPPAAIAAGFDTVSVCLSKGLGAPVGSVLVGRAELVDEARRWRKMLGGGMRQAGILAAAGRHAVDHHVDRLADDHVNAAALAQGLSTVDGLKIVAQHTNMVFVERLAADGQSDDFAAQLEANGVKTSGGTTMRLVCHLDVSANDIDVVIEAFRTAVPT